MLVRKFSVSNGSAVLSSGEFHIPCKRNAVPHQCYFADDKESTLVSVSESLTGNHASQGLRS
jgi:hypothetical protein